MIIDFVDATLATGGGKGANLGELQRAGFPVPAGFIIDADTYRRLVSHLDVPALLSDGPDRVRDAVEAQPLPADLADQVARRLAAWGAGVAVAVRSSATAEDLPDASFAGQQDTFLGVVGLEAVLDAVRRCWGSLWTARAVDYRARNGFDHAEVALAVVVQQLVDADTAGVLFNRNPITGAHETLIDASWGLGESVVSGSVTPDQFRTTTSRVLERIVGTKETRVDRDAPTTRTTEVAAADRERLCLADGHVLQLARLGDLAQQHFGRPMDLEWAFAGSTLWLLQARPITTVPTSAPAASATTVTGRRITRASRAFHADLVEHYPGPYPLDLAAIFPMHQQLQASMAGIGLTSTPIRDLVTLEPDGTIRAAYPDVRPTWRLARLLRYSAPDPAGWPAIEASFRDQLGAARLDVPAALPDADLKPLLDRILSIISEIARIRFLDYVGPAQLTALRLNGYLRFAGRPDLDAYDLLGSLDYVTTVIDRDLRQLATLDQHSSGYLDARQRFLDEHGARTTKLYLPFSNRSWREDPEALETTLDAVRRAEPRKPATRNHQDLVDEITGTLPAFMRRRFVRTLATWRAGHAAREASVYLIEEAYVLARRVTDEIGRRLTQRGALATSDQIRYLTIDEVWAALLGGTPPDETRLIAGRRAAARPRAAAAWWATTQRAEHEGLAGVAGSPGLATGPARIISGLGDFDQLRQGDVLVCRYTDPSWTPLFSLASAVVAETGGRLSHAAIVAREYGIPAVMGARDATSLLTNDLPVTVDGLRGTVSPAR